MRSRSSSPYSPESSTALLSSLTTSSFSSPDTSAGHLINMGRYRGEFQDLLQDRWRKKQMNDPSIAHDMASKVRCMICY